MSEIKFFWILKNTEKLSYYHNRDTEINVKDLIDSSMFTSPVY